MSTKAPRRVTRDLAACTALLALAGCAGAPTGGQDSHFSDIRFGRSAESQPIATTPLEPSRRESSRAKASAQASAAGPALRPRLAAPDMPAAVAPVSLDQAQARVTAYLDRSGFALESRPEGGGTLVSATRMGPPRALEGQAICALEAMRRPSLSSTELTVRLTPAPSGVQVQASARFVEIDTKLLSGDLARETCRSRGVLESAVQRAAVGG